MVDAMNPEPLGEHAYTLRIADAAGAASISRVRAVAEAISAAAIPGVEDVVASPGRVTVACGPRPVHDVATLRDGIAAAAARAAMAAAAEGNSHEIPVAYDGPDLDVVCHARGIDRRRLIALHTEPDYVVEAIGFLPGFGYLTGLPASLAAARRATPRARVPAGAVGIGGGQTGVYPFASPGGWNLIGRSPAKLFDIGRPRPATLAVGDRVRFMARDLPEADREDVAATTIGGCPGNPAITVLQPGLFTTVQDQGRRGHRSSGVPLSGAADGLSLRVANLLVGNPESAAGIECTLLGPTLRCDRDLIVAVVGAEFPGLPAGRAVRLAAGAEIALGHAISGCRGVVAIAGGVDVPCVLGSRSTLVAAGFGGLSGRPLRAGDRLAIGEPSRPPVASGGMPSGRSPARGRCVLRVIPGEQIDVCGDAVWRHTFRTSSRSDRMGVRLEGEPLPGAERGGSMASIAVFPGTVQLPPDGLPIILLADAQTIGGYPVIGQVIAADLPLAAQLRPGQEVDMRSATADEARAAMGDVEARIAAFEETLR
jgi:KipI family sensor histidine kinase inhibitor